MPNLNTMHLFAGAGGGLLADLILGHKPIVAVEWDGYACQVLRERAADGWFPDLHVWEGDVRLFDPSEYKGRVGILHAGFPCQDLSVAGKQSGLGEGTRSGLYREVLRIAGVLRPRLMFLENVAAILSGGLEHVLADLAAIGYDCRWTCLRASEVGAPHHRDRWWLRAVRNANDDGQPSAEISRSIASGSDDHPTWEKQASKLEGPGEQFPHVADTVQQRQQGQREHERCINSAQDQNRKANRVINSSKGDKTWWELEPELGRVAYGVANRMDRLKALGNGQVPLQAAVAWRMLGGE